MKHYNGSAVVMDHVVISGFDEDWLNRIFFWTDFRTPDKVMLSYAGYAEMELGYAIRCIGAGSHDLEEFLEDLEHDPILFRLLLLNFSEGPYL